MTHSLSERTLALAGIYQACKLVSSIASHGLADLDAQEVCIRSLLVTNPADTAAVYGGHAGIADRLRIGLNTLIEQFSQADKRDIDLTRYVITIMALERKLMKRAAMLQTISIGIDKANAQSEYFAPGHENVLASLADLYTNTISTLPPRVIVKGEHGHLSNPANANRVRALLLAALRSAILWRQCGGNRWQLLFQRKNIIAAAELWRSGRQSEL
jgi:high frequency lysogenization protein